MENSSMLTVGFLIVLFLVVASIPVLQWLLFAGLAICLVWQIWNKLSGWRKWRNRKG